MPVSGTNYRQAKGRSRGDRLGFGIIQAGNDGGLK